jgi:hypothetical protein
MIDSSKADQHERRHEGNRTERLPPVQPLTEPDKPGAERNQRIDRAHRAGHRDLPGLSAGGQCHQSPGLPEPCRGRPSCARPALQPACGLGTKRGGNGQRRNGCAVHQHRGQQPARVRRVAAQHEYARSVGDSGRSGQHKASPLVGREDNPSGPLRVADQGGRYAADRHRDAGRRESPRPFACHHDGQQGRHSSIAGCDRARHAYRSTLERRVIGQPPGQCQYPGHEQSDHGSPAVHASRTYDCRESI